MVNDIVGRLPPARAPGHSLRGLLRVPAVRAFAEWLVSEKLTGETSELLPVRGILFDKPAGANWSVPWHQDRVVAVRERRQTPGFSAWTRKAGVHHVDAPKNILEGMVTLRIHLDDVTESDGPLRVLAGTHRAGIMTPAAIESASQSIEH